MTRGRRLQIALAIDLAVAVAEVTGGLLAHSAGLLSTAAHDLADGGALALALFATRLVARPPTPARSFGLHRVTILTALANAAAVASLSILVAALAIYRVVRPPHVHGSVMIAFALVAVLGNGAAFLVLRERTSDLNLRAAGLHLAADAASSVGVLGAGALIAATGRFEVADPAVALAISVVVLAQAVMLVRESVDVLLESTPHGLVLSDLADSISSLAEVNEVHDLHCWSLSSEVRALSAHVVVAGHPSLESAQALSERIKEKLRDEHAIAHATIELECEPCVEPAEEVCAVTPAELTRSAPPS